MNKVYYITGAVILALVGFGIYSTQAQNTAADNADGIVVIEERGVAIIPDNTPDISEQNLGTNGKQPTADFQPLPKDKGVEVAPINQPSADKTSAPQNQTDNDILGVEESVIETTDY